MPRTCDLCDSPDRATIDELILAGRSLLSINKELGVSYGSLRGHVSHGHHLGVRATPAYVPVPVKSPHGPDMIAVFSEAESALFERVDEQYLAELSRTSRIPVAKLRRCHQGVPHAKGCAACDALEATEQRWNALVDEQERQTPPEPGGWVTRSEAERLIASGSHATNGLSLVELARPR